MAASYITLVILLIASASCVVVDLKECNNAPADVCTIHEVRIDPCKENPAPCIIKIGKSVDVSFDYTANFTADKMKTMVYWDGAVPIPFAGFDNDGCKYTACPAEPGKRQVYNYHLDVGKSLPPGTYPVKWMLWNANNESQYCCFRSDIKLKKTKKN